MRNISRTFVWICSFALGCAAFAQDTPQATAPKQTAVEVENACSYTGLNGNCTVTIDRLSPATPPTIYARTNAVITVKVANPSPFEDLSLDWTSTTVVVPPDVLASLLSSSVTGVLGKINAIKGARTEGAVPDPAPDISQKQEDLLEEINKVNPLNTANPALKEIASVLQSPPGDACWLQPAGQDKWSQTASCKSLIIKALTDAKGEAEEQANNKTETITIETLKKKAAGIQQEVDGAITSPEQEKLKTNQKALAQALNLRIVSSKISNLGDRFQALIDAINAIPDKSTEWEATSKICDAQPKDKNDQSQVWTLNYVNKLAPVVKRVSAATFSPDPGPFDSLTEPAKQALLKLTVQFQHSSPLEVSSGLMVPTKPYHSYTKAAVASNGTVTNNIVQENLTYTVVPAVFVHFLPHEFTGSQRFALFATVAAGYNPSTSAVEFAVGPSFSWHSLVLSGLFDVGRDTELRGGFTVNQSLGLTNAANPLTGTVWNIRPAIAVSVRLPLGGAGK